MPYNTVVRKKLLWWSEIKTHKVREKKCTHSQKLKLYIVQKKIHNWSGAKTTHIIRNKNFSQISEYSTMFTGSILYWPLLPGGVPSTTGAPYRLRPRLGIQASGHFIHKKHFIILWHKNVWRKFVICIYLLAGWILRTCLCILQRCLTGLCKFMFLY